MINLIVSPLIKKLDDIIDQERILFKEKKNDILLSLRNSLEKLMMLSVKNVEEETHDEVGKHFEDVADCVYEVEYIIDNQILLFGKSMFTGRGKRSSNMTGGLIGNLDNHNQFLQSVSKQKNKLDEFHSKAILLVQKKVVEPAKPHLELTPTSVNPKLPDGDQFFVGVVGISGLWRTAMVHAMMESLSREFRKPFFAWVHFSKYNEIHNLLRAVIEAFDMGSTPIDKELDMNMMGAEELGLYLYESLTKRPYLLMLEDVSDLELWDHLRRALPDNNLGSRVIITTHIHIRSLIEKSGGEGTQVYELPVENMTNVSLSEIRSIFDSSFDHLPHLLKLCYLYLGMFPEKSEINVDKLIRLWVAEGFIQSAKGGTSEEVAMDYVNELADRSLIEIVKRNATRIATCRVHPCLKDLFAKKSGELKLFHAFTSTDENVTVKDQKKLASHCGFRKDFKILEHARTRTLMVFSNDNDTVTKITKLDHFKKLTLLQVLDLEGTWFPASRKDGKTYVPEVIENLILLRYLGLNDTYIDYIPPFIKNLQALQTLYVDKDILVSIPNEINELKKLRHLYGRLSTQQGKSHFSLPELQTLGHGRLSTQQGKSHFSLPELQTLGHIEINYPKFNPKFNCTDLNMLRELYLVIPKSDFTRRRPYNIGAIIGEVKTLQTLFIKVNDGRVDLKSFSKFPNLLQLKLKGEVGELPSNMDEIFPKLKYLSMISDYNKKTPPPLQNLAKLPNLTILDLYHLSLDELKEGEAFPQLEILQLIKCTYTDLSFIETKMTKLKELWITESKNDNSIPEKVKSLLKLTPKDWGRHNDDDWPYFPRTMP